MSIDTFPNSVSVATKIGKYCRYQREKKNYSVNEFARKIELDPSFLLRLEHGTYNSIKFDVIEKIAAGFDMTVEDLLRKSQITTNTNTYQLPPIEFYLKEAYQFPDEAIDDVKLLIQLLKIKYKDKIKKMKDAHKKYWKR